jgi:hypothetical protein
MGFNLVDEGEYLHNALRIYDGDIPYLNFFSYQPPLYNYWNILAFRLFGISAFSARLLNSIIFSFVPVFIYLIAVRFSERLTSFIVALAFSFMEMSMERLYYHIFTFSALFLFFVSNDKSKPRIKLFISGLLFGITTLFRLDIGIIFFVGLSIGSILGDLDFKRKHIVGRFKNLRLFYIGFAIPLLLLALWLLNNSIVYQFVRSQITTPLQITSTYSLPIPAIWEVVPKDFNPKTIFHSYETFVFYLFLFVFAYFGIRLLKDWKRVWKETPELVLLFIVGLLTAPYMFGRTDLGHIIKGSISTFFIGAYLISNSRRYKKVLLMFPVLFIIIGLAQLVWSSNFYTEKIISKNGTVRLNKVWPDGTLFITADTISKAIHFVNRNTNPEDQVLAIPYMPGLYFLLDKPSKSYAGNILHTYLPDEGEYINQLSELNIKVVIYDPVNGPDNRSGFKQLKSYYPKLDSYIIDNYEVVDASPEGWLFMMKKNY